MNKFPGLGDRMRGRLKALGYWRQNRPDILRFCAERDYRPQYVYAWLKDRVPTYANLRRLARDLDAPIAWLVFGREAESAALPDAGPRSAPTAPAQVIDLPRLREVAEKLVQLEGDLAGIFQAFPDGYFWLDADGTVLSQRAGPGFESPALPADVIGRRVREVFPFDVAKTLEQALDEALRTGGLVSREYTQAHVDMVRAYEARFVPLAGRLPRERRVLVIVREITERRRAEQWSHKLALENAALYAEAERRRREAEVIAALARDINASLDLDTVLQQVVDGAREICLTDAAWIALQEPGTETMTLRCRTGVELPTQGRPVEPGVGAAGQV
ncbi:MAG: PAS domain-containing protein, partial [Candidatus Rokuibacteriota bacterium]